MKKQTMKQLRLGMAILALCSMSAVGGQAFADETYDALAARVTALEKATGVGENKDSKVSLNADTNNGENGVAIGKDSFIYADGANAVAIGYKATTNSPSSIVIGDQAAATISTSDNNRFGAIAIGRSATSLYGGAISLGTNAKGEGHDVISIGTGSHAYSHDTMAIGSSSSAKGPFSLAFGYGSSATNSYTMAFGHTSVASGNAAIANGYQSKALGDQSIAIGLRAKAGATTTEVDTDVTLVGSANEAIAIGDKAKAYANETVALGYNNKASGVYGIVVGSSAAASNRDGIAIGRSTSVTGDYGVALGAQSSAAGNNSLSFGLNSKSLTTSSVAIGDGARTGMLQGTDYDATDKEVENGGTPPANKHYYYKSTSKPTGWTDDTATDWTDTSTGRYYVKQGDTYYYRVTNDAIDDRYSIAIGQKAIAKDYDGVALGRKALSSGEYAIAIGGADDSHTYGAQATADQTIAVGVYSQATAVDAIAVGNSAKATGTQSLALMKSSSGAGDYSIAIGNTAQVAKAATNGMALGNNTKVNKENGTAIGNGATVDSESAIALGYGSKVSSSDGNVLSIGTTGGERKIIHVAKGEANTDAANYGQLIAKDTYTLTKQGTTNIYSATLKLNSDTGTAANGPTIQIDASNFGGSGSVSTTVTQGDTNAVSGGAVYTEVRPADGKYVKRNQTTAENLKALDDQVKANEGNITTNTGDIAGLKNMSNLTTEGQNQVKTYAQEAVKVEAGSKGIDVTKDTSVANQTTYKVALDKDTIGGEVGIGQVKDGNTGLVTGGTMYSELRPTDGTYVKNSYTTADNLNALDTQVKKNADDIADLKDMKGLSETGVKNLKGYAQEAVQVEGDAATGVKVEKGAVDANGNITYKVSIDNAKLSENLGTGKVEAGDTGLVTGGTVYTALHDKLGDGQNGSYISKDATVNANLKALDDAIGKEYGSTNNIAEDDNVKAAVGKLDKAMGQVSSLNGIKGLDNQAIGTDANPTDVSKAVLAVDGKVGNLDPSKTYNVLKGKESLASNLEKVDAALGDVNSLYNGTDAIKGKDGTAVSKANGLAGVMKAMDGKIGDLDQDKTYNVIDKAASVNDNLTAMDAKMGKLDKDGNTITAEGTVSGNLSALDTAMGNVKQLNAIKDKDGKAIGSDDKATNVADAVVAVDGKVGDLEKDGNYITKGTDLSTNLAAVDAKMGKLTEDGDYVKQDQTFAENFSALDKGLGKLKQDGNLVKMDNSAADNIAIIDTAIGSKDDYGTGYNISTGDDVSLKKNIGALDAAIGTTADGAFVSSGNSVGQNLNALDKGLSDLGERVNKVGAGAAALAALHVESFDPDDKFNLAVGFGHYKNANSGAIGAFYKPNHDTTFSIATTIGNGDNMLNAGISFKLGKSAHVEKTMVVKADYEALQQKVADQDDRLAAQDAQIEELKKQVAALVARG